MHTPSQADCKNLRRTTQIAPYLISFILAGFTVLTAQPSTNNASSPRQTIQSFYDGLVAVYAQKSNHIEDRVYHLIEQYFDVRRIAPMILSDRWKKLNGYEQRRFEAAVTTALRNRLLSEVERYSREGLPKLILTSEESKENFAELTYRVAGDRGGTKFTVYLLKAGNNAWRISNLKVNGESLVRYYYSMAKDLVNKYSVAYLEAELTDQGYVVLEDFEDDQVGTLPRVWHWRDQDNDKHKPYEVREEDGNKFLAARDEGESVILGKDIKWNLKKYPYISFRWRVHKIPEGADERFDKKVDSAAGLYVIYRKKLIFIPESVKYVWSSTLPVGSAMQRSGVGKPWMVVADTGKDGLGEWHTYVFNAYEAYKKTFGGNPPDTAIGIGILSDANSMNAQAFADYDDIRALKEADADSGIKQYLQAE